MTRLFWSSSDSYKLWKQDCNATDLRGPDSNREAIHGCFLSSHPRSLRGARPTSHFPTALPCLYKHQCGAPHPPIQNRQRFTNPGELTLITTMERCGLELDLPGFRFHPTEEELLDFYLHGVASRKKLNFDVIGTLNIYRHDPWELPSATLFSPSLTNFSSCSH